MSRKKLGNKNDGTATPSFFSAALARLFWVIVGAVIALSANQTQPLNPQQQTTTTTTKKDKTPTLEQWLRREMEQETCELLERKVPKGFWYSEIMADDSPEFSLTSAWLKPEYPSGMVAPNEIPALYKDQFSMGGQIPISGMYFNQAYLGNEAFTPIWSHDMVEEAKRKGENGEQQGGYGKDCLQVNEALKKYPSFVKDKRGIVIGSESPWVEGYALGNGASRILTLEFGKIKSEHEQIQTMVPTKFTEQFLNRKIPPFDFGITYSSLEHDGLGRYGDVLNPIGDLQSVAKILSVIKPGGLLFLGFPAGPKDALVFNAHRIYGLVRLPKIFAGWRFVDIIGSSATPRLLDQPVFVLQNLNGCIKQD